MSKIRVGIIGVGNCASSIIQGLSYYKNGKELSGLMHQEIGGYKVKDIEPVVAFDVDERKVGSDLSKAIFAGPNCTVRFAEVPNIGVEVLMGPVMDGVTEHSAKLVKVSKQKSVDVEKVLNEIKPDVVINNLPTGSIEASKYYATAAIKAGAGFVNGMPALIANNEDMVKLAEDNKVCLIGDDVKSQMGGTVFHRALLKLFLNRGVKIKNTYQLNIGGNTDFFNQVERRDTKLFTKMSSYKSLVPYDTDMWGCSAGYIDFLKDKKDAWTYIEGENFGGNPVRVVAWFSVIDSPNYAGTMVEAIRLCKIGLDRKISGILTSASAFLCKCPPVKTDDDEAYRWVEEFISGKRER